MILNYKLIKGQDITSNSLRNNVFSDYQIAKTIVNMYMDNPDAALMMFHKENVLACHIFYLNFHYLKIAYL